MLLQIVTLLVFLLFQTQSEIAEGRIVFVQLKCVICPSAKFGSGSNLAFGQKRSAPQRNCSFTVTTGRDLFHAPVCWSWAAHLDICCSIDVGLSVGSCGETARVLRTWSGGAAALACDATAVLSSTGPHMETLTWHTVVVGLVKFCPRNCCRLEQSQTVSEKNPWSTSAIAKPLFRLSMSGSSVATAATLMDMMTCGRHVPTKYARRCQRFEKRRGNLIATIGRLRLRLLSPPPPSQWQGPSSSDPFRVSFVRSHPS